MKFNVDDLDLIKVCITCMYRHVYFVEYHMFDRLDLPHRPFILTSIYGKSYNIEPMIFTIDDL